MSTRATLSPGSHGTAFAPVGAPISRTNWSLPIGRDQFVREIGAPTGANAVPWLPGDRVARVDIDIDAGDFGSVAPTERGQGGLVEGMIVFRGGEVPGLAREIARPIVAVRLGTGGGKAIQRLHSVVRARAGRLERRVPGGALGDAPV